MGAPRRSDGQGEAHCQISGHHSVVDFSDHPDGVLRRMPRPVKPGAPVMRVFNFPSLLDPSCWMYFDEGAANVLLRHKRYQSLLLRLRKKPASLLFYNYHVISQLIQPRFLGRFALLETKRHFLQELDDRHHSSRPEHRRIRRINLDQRFGLLLENLSLPNATALPGTPKDESITVEFKPKSSLKGKYPACKWCMQQYYKVASGTRKKVGDFCPLDLYSEKATRVRLAVENLWNDPESSMKVFVDGRCLERTPGDYSLMDVIIFALQQSEILSILKALQRRLDTVPVETIEEVFSALKDTDNLKAGQAGPGAGPSWQDWLNTIKNLSSRSESEGRRGGRRQPTTVELMSDEEKRHSILRFLLAATIRDCSLMITISKRNDFPSRPPTVRLRSQPATLPAVPTRGPSPENLKSSSRSEETALSTGFRDDCTPPSNRILKSTQTSHDPPNSTVPRAKSSRKNIGRLISYFNIPSAVDPWIYHKPSGYYCRIKLIDLDMKSAHQIPEYHQKYRDIVQAFRAAGSPRRCCPA